jgi:hypothetical protein
LGRDNEDERYGGVVDDNKKELLAVWEAVAESTVPFGTAVVVLFLGDTTTSPTPTPTPTAGEFSSSGDDDDDDEEAVDSSRKKRSESSFDED